MNLGIRTAAQCFGLLLLTAAFASAADTPDPAGKPKQFVPGKGPAVAVWEDKGMWNLQVTWKDDNKSRVVFTGRVVVEGDKYTGDYGSLEKAKGADADYVRPHRDGKGFDFRLTQSSVVAIGLDFTVGPAATGVKFKVLIDGTEDPKKILIGGKGVHPEKAEFTLPVNSSNGKR
jgi:hypothetical protein